MLILEIQSPGNIIYKETEQDRIDKKILEGLDI
jgi:hypothetical protein